MKCVLNKRRGKEYPIICCVSVFLPMLLGMIVWTWSAKAETFVGITACQVINTPGEYRVLNDLSGTTGQSCLNIKSSDVTIDGNGKNITDTSGNYAVLILSDATPWSNISVSNFTSPNGVWTYRSASYVTFDQVTIGGYSVSAADHTSLTNSVINGTVSITNLNLENPTYATFSNNVVTGSNSRLAFFSGDNHVEGNCDITGMTIDDNTFTNTVSSIADNPVTVFLGCTQNGSFSGNTVNSTGQATGLLIRDGYSYNTLANNTIQVNTAVNDTRGAVALVSGSLGGAPNFNTFSGNIVIGENSKALFHYLETYGNLYQNNLFISNSAVGSTFWDTSSVVTDNRNIFSHNTFINRGSGPALSMYAGLRNTTVQDNIFLASNANMLTGSLHLRTNLTINHNLYYRPGGSVAFQGIGDFVTWVATVGDTNSLEADPLFVDYANGDYTLQSDSPARGAGTDGSDIGVIGTTIPPDCTEEWSCGDWSACVNNIQTRACVDINSCGTVINQPPLFQDCDSTIPAQIVDLVST